MVSKDNTTDEEDCDPSPLELDKISLSGTVPPDLAGQRLDVVLAKVFPKYSRARLSDWVKNRYVSVNGDVFCAVKQKVKGNEVIVIDAPVLDEMSFEPENIPLTIVYEDADILIVDKPAGMVVHPAAGNYSGTLLNALLYYHKDAIKVPRAGIVHRLDKDTTGLMVVAKTIPAQTNLVKQLQARTVKRSYTAVVTGVLAQDGSIDQPIGRHQFMRTKMAVTPRGKPARTHYKIVELFPSHTYIDVSLETGRTHQIRVHMSYLGYPLVGDTTYSRRIAIPKGASDNLIGVLENFKRQALHARELGLIHPVTGKLISVASPLPDDLLQLLAALRNN